MTLFLFYFFFQNRACYTFVLASCYLRNLKILVIHISVNITILTETCIMSIFCFICNKTVKKKCISLYVEEENNFKKKRVYWVFFFFFLTCRYENPKLHASHFIWEKKTKLPETCLFPMKDVLAFYYVITGNKTFKLHVLVMLCLFL